MPNVTKIVLAGIGVHRPTGGVNRTVRPEIGKPYSFTQEEVDAILKNNPKALRDPVNETHAAAVQSEEAGTDTTASTKVNPRRAPAKQPAVVKDPPDGSDEGQDTL